MILSAKERNHAQLDKKALSLSLENRNFSPVFVQSESLHLLQTISHSPQLFSDKKVFHIVNHTDYRDGNYNNLLIDILFSLDQPEHMPMKNGLSRLPLKEKYKKSHPEPNLFNICQIESFL